MYFTDVRPNWKHFFSLWAPFYLKRIANMRFIFPEHLLSVRIKRSYYYHPGHLKNCINEFLSNLRDYS